MKTAEASRRHFILAAASCAATSAMFSCAAQRAQDNDPIVSPSPPLPGGDQADIATKITPQTIAEAEKLAGIKLTARERDMVAKHIGEQIAMLDTRVARLQLPNDLAPATVFHAQLPDKHLRQATTHGDPKRIPPPARPCPTNDVDIAFASITDQAGWLRTGQLTSQRLTKLYLKRLKQFGPQLKCTITLMEKQALEMALVADQELKAGRDRGPLHGIPWGAKDLLDTAGVNTTWGAAPYRDRIPNQNAKTVEMLSDAGAVLIAKLSLGALAYGDIWFGGTTKNPWNLEQGSSGSSAGPAAATAAGLVGFSIGSETCGSIVSPCMRCGVTGLRPTFGRVPRTGAMSLCWSMDKLGPICRYAQDTAPVLDAINGYDPHDPSSVDEPFTFDVMQSADNLRLGYDPRWFDGPQASDEDRQALAVAKKAGCKLIELDWPDRPWDTLFLILIAETAAAFEQITRQDLDDELQWQAPEAWPNTFRTAWFIPAVELIQVSRFRREAMQIYYDQLMNVDALIAPSFAGSLLISTNCTGHPSITLPTTLTAAGTPTGITLIGRLFDEGTILRIAMAMEKRFPAAVQRPPLFS